ncbi:MAG: hypothetical protein HOO91_16825 [Bacteroidales bacterium]|nr:hypothetical protein [Bacteroidales bacterium]
MKTVTIFFHGTLHDNTAENNLITILSKNTNGLKLSIPGIATEKNKSLIKKYSTGLEGALKKIGAVAYAGNDIFQTAFVAYKLTTDSFLEDTTFNLVGWSRGAITCTVCANILEKEYKEKNVNIKINLILIDPCNGPLESYYTLNTTCVKNVLEILMINETALHFPVSYISNTSSFVSFQREFLPGVHGSAVDRKNKQYGFMFPILGHLCTKFLNGNGVQIAISPLDDKIVIESFSKYIVERFKIGKKLVCDRKEIVNLYNIEMNNRGYMDYFVSKIHLIAFNNLCPNISKVIFSFKIGGNKNNDCVDIVQKDKCHLWGITNLKNSLKCIGIPTEKI